MGGINYAIRRSEEIAVSWANGATESAVINLADGAFGSLIVESGASELIGKTWTICAYSNDNPAKYATVAMFTAKTIVSGSNPLTAEEIASVGGVKLAKIRLGGAVSGAQAATLLWKS